MAKGRREPLNTTSENRIPVGIAPRLLRRREAASYLGLSPAALDALRLRGEVVPVPVPSLRRQGEVLRVPLFDVADLDAAVDRWKVGGVS